MSAMGTRLVAPVGAGLLLAACAGCVQPGPPPEPGPPRATPEAAPAPRRAVARMAVTPEDTDRVDGFAVVRIRDADLVGDAAPVPRLAGAAEVAFDPGRHHETFRAAYGKDRLAARVAGGGIGRVRLPEGDDFALCGPVDASSGASRAPIRWERLVADGMPGLASLQVTDGWLDRERCRAEPARSVSLPVESVAWGTTYLLRFDRGHRTEGPPPLVLILPRADRMLVRGDLVVDRGAITYVFWPRQPDGEDPPSVELDVAIADLDRWSLGFGPLPSSDRPRTSAELAATPVVHVRVVPPSADDGPAVRARVLVDETWLERWRSRLGGAAPPPMRAPLAARR
jgi:hypothetical protein